MSMNIKITRQEIGHERDPERCQADKCTVRPIPYLAPSIETVDGAVNSIRWESGNIGHVAHLCDAHFAELLLEMIAHASPELISTTKKYTLLSMMEGDKT